MKQFGPHIKKICLSSIVCLTAILGFVGPAQADASAVRVFTCQNSFMNTTRESLTPCSDGEFHISDRVSVTIKADGDDIGNPGAFYIGILKDGYPFGQFVADRGQSIPSSTSLAPLAPPAPGVGDVSISAGNWVAMHEGLYDPAEHFQSIDGSPRQYLVATNDTICRALGGGHLELWAGYGALNAFKRQVIEFYKPRLSKTITVEQLAITYIQNDMSERKNAWKVLEVNCSGEYGG